MGRGEQPTTSRPLRMLEFNERQFAIETAAGAFAPPRLRYAKNFSIRVARQSPRAAVGGTFSRFLPREEPRATKPTRARDHR